MSSTTLSSVYGLTNAQFVATLSPTLDEEPIHALGSSSAQGNHDSINMLQSIALRQDPLGTLAENILFDLFSGKTPASAGVDKYIQQTCSDLLKNSQKNPEQETWEKLRSPSKLLYMAGAEETSIDQKRALSLLFSRAQSALDETDIWGRNRLLTSDEISHATSRLPDTSVHYPNALSQKNPSETLLELIMNGTLHQEAQYFPLNTGNHWILFGIYQEEGCPKAFVFNSLPELSQEDKAQIIAAATLAGVAEKDLEFIEKDLQTHVPNGCGVFVSHALRSIAENKHENPARLLRDFAENFPTQTLENQGIFNIQQRRQIYGHSIERASP